MNSAADSVESMQSKHNVRPIGRLLNTMPTFQPVLVKTMTTIIIIFISLKKKLIINFM
jgi:hypothetical protein